MTSNIKTFTLKLSVKNFATRLLESVLFQNGAQGAINPVVLGEAVPSGALTRFSPVYVIHKLTAIKNIDFSNLTVRNDTRMLIPYE